MATRRTTAISDADLARIVEGLTRAQRETETLADQIEDAFEKALRRAQARTYERMSAIIADGPDFKRLKHNERLRWWVSHQRAIEDAIDTAGYQRAVGQYVNSLPRFADLVNSMATAQGESFVQFPKSTIDYLKRVPVQRFVGLGTAADARLKDILYEEIFSGPAKSGALERLRLAIKGISDSAAGGRPSYAWKGGRGFYDWHATTYARTAHSTFSRGLQAAQAEELGIDEDFLYLGPIDKETREFCRERVGKVYTRKEIDAMSNGQNAEVADVFVHGGGYNCRHQWVAVTPGVAEKLREKGKAAVVGSGA